MDTTSTTMSFRSYNSKADEQDEEAFRRNTRKRLVIIAVSTLVLVAVSVGMTAGVLIPTLEKSNSNKDVTSPISVNSTLGAVCQVTLYPDSCNSSITSLNLQSNDNNNNNLDDPEAVFELSLQVSLNELATVSSFVSSKIADRDISSGESMTRNSLRDCKDLIDDAIDKVNKSRITKLTESKIDDVRTWLSTAVTDHETCLDGIEEAGDESLAEEARRRMRKSTEYASNSLAIATNLLSILRRFQMSVHRKLLWWEGSDVRRVMEEEKVRPNVTVAKDGSGDYVTITEAVKGAPEMEEGRYVIYVKEGVYVENVMVDMLKWNVMIYGDGMNKTIVSGSLNQADRTPTFSSGTLIAVGQGFIAKDMGFVNTAGAKKGQAVAVRSSSDMSIFYRCSFDAYQDTLYVHSNRQLFRSCLVTGTIDFIFGFATVVFEDCDLLPRQPLPSQFNAVTAHGKFDKNQNTGISIQRCRVAPNGVVTAPTYLGRPWKKYSTTVVMDSVIDGVVNPLGWSPWAPNEDPPSTIFYGEYRNGGPGSGLGGRVKWDGYRPNMTAQEAAGFTVDSFIQGDKWLPPGGSLFDGANV